MKTKQFLAWCNLRRDVAINLRIKERWKSDLWIREQVTYYRRAVMRGRIKVTR